MRTHAQQAGMRLFVERTCAGVRNLRRIAFFYARPSRYRRRRRGPASWDWPWTPRNCTVRCAAENGRWRPPTAALCPARALADDALPAPAPGSVLDQLREAAIVQLEDRGFPLTCCCPWPIARWTSAPSPVLLVPGFLGAFGLAAGAAPPLSEEGSEALQDLARTAKASAEQR